MRSAIRKELALAYIASELDATTLANQAVTQSVILSSGGSAEQINLLLENASDMLSKAASIREFERVKMKESNKVTLKKEALFKLYEAMMNKGLIT